MTRQEEKPTDRPYSRPQLVIYGDIKQITQTNAGGQSSDNNMAGGKTN